MKYEQDMHGMGWFIEGDAGDHGVICSKDFKGALFVGAVEGV